MNLLNKNKTIIFNTFRFLIIRKSSWTFKKLILLFYFELPFFLTNSESSYFLFIFVFRMHLKLWMVLNRFWIVFGSVAILIYQSLNIHLFALYMPYIFKDIWHIFWKWMNEIWLPKPIQNHSKTKRTMTAKWFIRNILSNQNQK